MYLVTVTYCRSNDDHFFAEKCRRCGCKITVHFKNLKTKRGSYLLLDLLILSKYLNSILWPNPFKLEYLQFTYFPSVRPPLHGALPPPPPPRSMVLKYGDTENPSDRDRFQILPQYCSLEKWFTPRFWTWRGRTMASSSDPEEPKSSKIFVQKGTITFTLYLRFDFT